MSETVPATEVANTPVEVPVDPTTEPHEPIVEPSEPVDVTDTTPVDQLTATEVSLKEEMDRAYKAQKPSIGRTVVYRDSDGLLHPLIIHSVYTDETQRELVNGHLFVTNVSAPVVFVEDIPRNTNADGVNQDVNSWDFPVRV